MEREREEGQRGGMKERGRREHGVSGGGKEDGGIERERRKEGNGEGR